MSSSGLPSHVDTHSEREAGTQNDGLQLQPAGVLVNGQTFGMVYWLMVIWETALLLHHHINYGPNTLCEGACEEYALMPD